MDSMVLFGLKRQLVCAEESTLRHSLRYVGLVDEDGTVRLGNLDQTRVLARVRTNPLMSFDTSPSWLFRLTSSPAPRSIQLE